MTSLELFINTKKAYLAGDIATVKDNAIEAGKRLDARGYVLVGGIGRVHVDDLNWALENKVLVEKEGSMVLSASTRQQVVPIKSGGRIKDTLKDVLDTRGIAEFFARMEKREAIEETVNKIADETVKYYEEQVGF